MNIDLHSEKRVTMLKSRAQRCVCRSCGERLSLRQIDFNDFEDARTELFCERCDRLEFGTEPEIYASAQYYVDEYDLNLYPDMGKNAVTRRMTIVRVVEIMGWALENLGYLGKDGFSVPPAADDKVLGECLVLNDRTIGDLERELGGE